MIWIDARIGRIGSKEMPPPPAPNTPHLIEFPPFSSI
jgi:hypothetical protein